MIAIDFKRLIGSATYYLSYQDRIGRNFMINESSLKYPIADYLTSLEIPLAKIQLELSHPNLYDRSIDFVTTDHTKTKIEYALEFKISRQNTKYEPEQKRIFNDLMRLYLLTKSNDSACYFLMIGTQINFIQYFRSIVSKKPTENRKDIPDPEGFYLEWFKFKEGEEKSFDVQSIKGNDYEKIYSAFKKDHEPPEKGKEIELPDKIKTTCIAISALSREFPTPYVGGIWKVE